MLNKYIITYIDQNTNETNQTWIKSDSVYSIAKWAIKERKHWTVTAIMFMRSK